MGIDLSNLQPLLGERRVGFSTLKACKMLTRRGGVYYVHIAGAGRLYPAPLPHGLFSIEEGRLLYVLANTLQARNELTRPNDEDILILAKAAIPNNNVSLNLGAVLVRYLEYQSNVSQGPLTCGGVIIVLATTMGINLDNLQPLLGERCVGFSTLKACKMLPAVE